MFGGILNQSIGFRGYWSQNTRDNLDLSNTICWITTVSLDLSIWPHSNTISKDVANLRRGCSFFRHLAYLVRDLVGYGLQPSGWSARKGNRARGDTLDTVSGNAMFDMSGQLPCRYYVDRHI